MDTAGSSLVVWVLRHLGLETSTAPLIEAALEDAGWHPGALDVTWGLEVHHDGSDRVDLAVGKSSSAGRRVGLGPLEITTGDFDVWEYDIDPGEGWQLAGVFHGVAAAQLPTQIEPLGAPVLASHLAGRAGQVRLLVPVRSQQRLAELCAYLRRAGIAEASVERLQGMAPLVTGPQVVRLGVEYLAESGSLGPRLGVEVLLNPAAFDVASVLAPLGVPAAALARLAATASAVPLARHRRGSLPFAPKVVVPPWVDAVGYVHFSASWAPGVEPRVKSYLMVTSRVVDLGAGEAASGPMVRRAGQPWPDRLSWAREQLPLNDSSAVEAVRSARDSWREALGGGASADLAQGAADGDVLDQRLRGGGLTQSHADVALSEVEPIVEPPAPWLPWFEMMRAACLAVPPAVPGDVEIPLSDAAALSWLATRTQDLPEAARALPFADLWWPSVRAATAEMVDAHPGAFAGVAPGALQGLQVQLLSRVSMVSAPTLLKVMDEGMTFGQRFLRQAGGFSSDPPRAAFARFCASLVAGRLDTVFVDYPVLPSLIGTAVRQWHEATLEMLTRVQRHCGELADVFGVDASVELTAVMASAGDQHNDGRSVAVLRLGEANVVYKPRDMGLEQLWVDLLEVLGEHGAPLRAAQVLSANDGTPYGFVEFIHHVPAATQEEVHAFYRNAGRTLAVLYALSATDCHHENLIAQGDQLVLVDAEALFETRSTPMHSMEPSENRSLGTVMDVGLLPVWMWLEGEQQAIDISALGAAPETMRGRASRSWQMVNTDVMRRGPVEVIPAAPTSLPTPAGQVPDLRDYVDDLVTGFEQGYGALVAARDELRERLLDVADLQRRLIQRATYIYAALLFRSCEPEALRSRNARAMVLERLARAYLGGPPQVWKLLGAEQSALARLDVPIFETDLRGTETSWLDGYLPDWPGEDALAGVLTRLAGLNEDDLRWQTKLIRSAVAAHYFSPAGDEMTGAGAGERTAEVDVGVAAAEESSDGIAGVPDVAGLAQRIGARVADDALRAEGAATWMTLALLNDAEHANVQRIGTGLYDGILGVATYLHESGQHALATAALSPLLDELISGDAARVRRQLLTVGLGWSGAGGYLRALRWLRHQGWLEPSRADEAVAAVLTTLSPAMFTQDRWLDVMNGTAGLVVPLAAEISQARSGSGVDAVALAQLETLLAAAAEHLLAHQRDDGGWTTLPGRAPLTGYAHGASGIALALVVAHLSLGEQRYLDAALQGLAYEAATFDPAAGNWPDFRDTARSGFMLGWCAGAPGIALTRMRLVQLLPDHPAAEQWAKEMEVAARTTAEVGMLERDHVCCGNFGRVAILQALGHEHGRDDWLAAASGLRNRVVAQAGRGLPRPFLGIPEFPASTGREPGVDTGHAPKREVLAVPGLMTGLAGQGWLLDRTEPAATHEWVSALLL